VTVRAVTSLSGLDTDTVRLCAPPPDGNDDVADDDDDVADDDDDVADVDDDVADTIEGADVSIIHGTAADGGVTAASQKTA
jgi:hypothetical protein